MAFASRSLTSAERNYAATEREALACVWSVEKWKTFLWGHRFTLRTDHQALETLLSPQAHGRAGMRIARWAARLMVYQFDVKYIKGTENIVADCLSRLHHSESSDAQSEEDDFVVTAVGFRLSQKPASGTSAVETRCWLPFEIYYTRAGRG